MVKRLWLAASLVACATAASAQPIASMMSCGQVQTLVARSGPLLLYLTPTTYDVIDKNPAFCGRRQSEPLYTKTRDSAQCLAGYVCSTLSIRNN